MIPWRKTEEELPSCGVEVVCCYLLNKNISPFQAIRIKREIWIYKDHSPIRVRDIPPLWMYIRDIPGPKG